MSTPFLVILGVAVLMIFQRPIVNFLVNHFVSYDWLNNLFSTKEERLRSREIELALTAEPQSIQVRVDSILHKCSGLYKAKPSRQSDVVKQLPPEVQDFFSKYDYLKFGGTKVLDIKRVRSFVFGDMEYIRIGYDSSDYCDYLMRPGSCKDGTVYVCYAPGSDRARESGNDTEEKRISTDLFQSFPNFILYFYLYNIGSRLCKSQIREGKNF